MGLFIIKSPLVKYISRVSALKFANNSLPVNLSNRLYPSFVKISVSPLKHSSYITVLTSFKKLMYASFCLFKRLSEPEVFNKTILFE